MKKALAILAVSGLALAATADVLVIDISGWETNAGYLGAGNSNATFNLGVGTTIDSATYSISFDSLGASWRSELVMSLNDSTLGAFFDHTPSNLNSGGNFTGSGSFGSAPGSWIGGPFTLTTGQLYVEVYETFNDSGIDARFRPGSTITVTYTPIPAPGSLALLGLAGFAARRRRA